MEDLLSILEPLTDAITAVDLSPQMVILILIGMGAFLTVVGLMSAFAGPSAEARRMQASVSAGMAGGSGSLIRASERDPKGLLKAFVPSSKHERGQMALKLKRAGIYAPDAAWTYYLTRSVLGIGLPLAFIGLLYAPAELVELVPVLGELSSLSVEDQMKVLVALAVLGFYGPAVWLYNKTKNRKQEIEHGLPYALDVLHVSVEAGLGFDAAMERVAHELVDVSPALAQEFTIVQMEIQAGKERDRAMLDFASRTDVQEVASFAHVIIQSQQFGTSIGEALATYAHEMRVTRELKATSRANKLPVQMSGVVAACSMPVLLMITCVPVIIRWMESMN